MKIVANVRVREEEQLKTLFNDQEWEDRIYDDLSTKFIQELRKMKPLYFKEEDIREGTYLDHIEYRLEAFVFSRNTFQTLMKQLKDDLSDDAFERVRNTFINTI